MSQYQARVRASTKRPPPIVAGKRGKPVTNLSEVWCTPLDPVSSEIALRLGTKAAHELVQTFVLGTAGAPRPDIREGDVLVVGGVDYPIKSCAEWTRSSVYTLHLVLEAIKGRGAV